MSEDGASDVEDVSVEAMYPADSDPEAPAQQGASPDESLDEDAAASGSGRSGTQTKAALGADAGELAPSGDAGAIAGDWQRALGASDLSVSSSGVASDPDGNAILAGDTNGGLDGDSRGGVDAFVAKYSASGKLEWTRQLGTSDDDTAGGVSADDAGNVFVAGTTAGALGGDAAGFGDAFVAKYSAGGELEWTRQLGTSEPDGVAGVSADAAGDVVFAGFSLGTFDGARDGSDADAIVAKLSASGELLWARQLGSQTGYDERASAVDVAPDGSVFVAGHTFGALAGENRGSADAFIAKYSATGELAWVHQRGEADYDSADAVASDAAGNVYVAGHLDGFLVGGPGVIIPGTPLLAKYSAAGELLWEQLLDDASAGAASGLAVAGSSVFLAGYSTASVGAPNQGLYDTFVAVFSESGERSSSLGLGVSGNDRATGVSADVAGNVFIAHEATNVDGEGTDETFLSRRAPSLTSP